MKIHIFHVIILLFISTASYAKDILTGQVIRVTDGDTVTIESAQSKIKIRLAEIDSPEKNQPWGQQAKQALTNRLLHQYVKVVQQTIDRYGRVVGHIYLQGEWINAELIQQGHAWVYRRYSNSKQLIQYELAAQDNGHGLWSLPQNEQIPPWVWRRQAKSKKSLKHCNPSKKYCKHMSSCKEAKYYLSSCGLKLLDRDKDGIPCESICS